MSESEKEDYTSEASCENESPESEVEDEDSDDYDNEYDNAIERYAELIREVPEHNLSGIVETVEKIFEPLQQDNTDDVICGILVTAAVILAASLSKLYFS